ncbi:hypothetical protein HFP57_11325 [Parasphingopyxis algicola]|uniref:hypothetical protein n=1 Tax=Parasphingopyxis algicola TaxID=2026624 RepID=UPI0015A02823|nr:hypothetical protein [Parasphingopyxis algicola]QLC25550.1 hypothetical protein HFP57_11325 [Parasphingopyxis algicola]
MRSWQGELHADTAGSADSSSSSTLIIAVAACDEGATGEGVIIAIFDSSIDTDSEEFAGRSDGAS